MTTLCAEQIPKKVMSILGAVLSRSDCNANCGEPGTSTSTDEYKTLCVTEHILRTGHRPNRKAKGTDLVLGEIPRKRN